MMFVDNMGSDSSHVFLLPGNCSRDRRVAWGGLTDSVIGRPGQLSMSCFTQLQQIVSAMCRHAVGFPTRKRKSPAKAGLLFPTTGAMALTCPCRPCRPSRPCRRHRLHGNVLP